MKQYGDYIIPDAGKYLYAEHVKGIKMPAGVEYEEREINVDNISSMGDFVVVDFLLPIKIDTYANMKKTLVNKIYSNDDQIAIMLNDDVEAMNRMQEWRSWFSMLIHKILENNVE